MAIDKRQKIQVWYNDRVFDCHDDGDDSDNNSSNDHKDHHGKPKNSPTSEGL